MIIESDLHMPLLAEEWNGTFGITNGAEIAAELGRYTIDALALKPVEEYSLASHFGLNLHRIGFGLRNIEFMQPHAYDRALNTILQYAPKELRENLRYKATDGAIASLIQDGVDMEFGRRPKRKIAKPDRKFTALDTAVANEIRDGIGRHDLADALRPAGFTGKLREAVEGTPLIDKLQLLHLVLQEYYGYYWHHAFRETYQQTTTGHWIWNRRLGQMIHYNLYQGLYEQTALMMAGRQKEAEELAQFIRPFAEGHHPVGSLEVIGSNKRDFLFFVGESSQ